MHKILGIDLGTTNSVAAYYVNGVATPIGFTASEQNFPSVVSIERNGKFEVGAKAKRSNRSKIYSAKRFIGRKFADPEVQQALQSMELPYQVGEAIDGSVQLTVDGREFSPVEIGAMVLRKIKEAAEAQYGAFSRAIITVPAYFRESQVAATREAGRLAGFHMVKIINEPTAVAHAYKAVNPAEADSKLILVYDLDDSEFDVSLLIPTAGSFTVLEIGGDAFLGGDNIDNKLMRRVRDEVKKEQGIDIFSGPGSNEARVILKLETKRLKIGLSSSMEESIDLHNCNGANVYYVLRREEFEQLIAPMVERTIDITLETLARTGIHPADVDAVLLAGSGTQTPLVRRRLAEIFGEAKIKNDVNPMLCVAEGAAVLSAVTDTIDCVACMATNAIEQNFCGNCGAPLFGSSDSINDRTKLLEQTHTTSAPHDAWSALHVDTSHIPTTLTDLLSLLIRFDPAMQQNPKRLYAFLRDLAPDQPKLLLRALTDACAAGIPQRLEATGNSTAAQAKSSLARELVSKLSLSPNLAESTIGAWSTALEFKVRKLAKEPKYPWLDPPPTP